MLTIILITFAICFMYERLNPGWKLPDISTWPVRVVAINIVQLCVVLLAGISWEKWFQSYRIFALGENTSPLLGGFIAYFIATFIFYWWHRWRHTVDFFGCTSIKFITVRHDMKLLHRFINALWK